MSKSSKRPLTGFLETGLVTFWVVSREGGQIVRRPHVVTGPVQIVGTGPLVPPELRARAIPLSLEPEEDAQWR